jgi:hypothetical protein
MQDGSAVQTHVGGEIEADAFSAVWVKKDGGWRLQLVRELPGPLGAPSDGGADRLQSLAWLVGEWAHDEKDTKTTVAARWAKGQQFLMLEYSVRIKNDDILSLTQILGWDPIGGKPHSWVFDSRGGFGEGVWTRDGSTWTVEVAGVTAGGLRGWGTHKWAFVDNDAFAFQAIDRNLDGQPLPDIKINYKRTNKVK